MKSHKDFCNKFAFTIELLADPKAKLLAALGVGQSEWKGTMYWDRTTFLVDPSGVVRKVYTKVDPNGHEQAVLKDIAALRVDDDAASEGSHGKRSASCVRLPPCGAPPQPAPAPRASLRLLEDLHDVVEELHALGPRALEGVAAHD